MLQYDPSSSHLDGNWSPHWRSLHPAVTDYEILDALCLYLREKFAAHFENRAIISLRLFKQGPPYFRLPGGELCHWAQTTKTASLSIEAALCAHMPFLWSGAHKKYDLPPGQKAAKHLKIFVEPPLFPDMLKVPAAKFLFPIPRRKHRLRLAGGMTDPGWGTILCNVEDSEHKPPALHALHVEGFRPRPLAKIRFCVLRDPVKRFTSAVTYLWQRYHEAKQKSLQESLEQRITELENDRRGRTTDGQDLDEHLRPQINFIGSDPFYYTHIFRIGEQERLEYFLSEWVGAPVQLPHHNRSQSEKCPQLTPAQKQRVEALYAEDYKIWGKYF